MWDAQNAKHQIKVTAFHGVCHATLIEIPVFCSSHRYLILLPIGFNWITSTTGQYITADQIFNCIVPTLLHHNSRTLNELPLQLYSESLFTTCSTVYFPHLCISYKTLTELPQQLDSESLFTTCSTVYCPHFSITVENLNWLSSRTGQYIIIHQMFNCILSSLLHHSSKTLTEVPLHWSIQHYSLNVQH
jgi:hypothetical protein